MPVAKLFALTNPIAWAKYLNVKSIISILQGKSGKEKSITVYWIWLKCLLPPSNLPLPKLNGPSSCWSDLCYSNWLPCLCHDALVLDSFLNHIRSCVSMSVKGPCFLVALNSIIRGFHRYIYTNNVLWVCNFRIQCVIFAGRKHVLQ